MATTTTNFKISIKNQPLIILWGKSVLSWQKMCCINAIVPLIGQACRQLTNKKVCKDKKKTR